MINSNSLPLVITVLGIMGGFLCGQMLFRDNPRLLDRFISLIKPYRRLLMK